MLMQFMRMPKTNIKCMHNDMVHVQAAMQFITVK